MIEQTRVATVGFSRFSGGNMDNLVAGFTRSKFRTLCIQASAYAAALVLCGCTSAVRTNPNNIEIGPAAVSHLPPRPVTLVNGHASESELRFSTPPHTLIIEPKHMTETAIEALRIGLDKYRPPKGKASPKRITLRVTSPRSAGAFPNPAVAISLEAQFGDGTRTLVEGQGYSARGANRSFEVAVQNALQQLLSDQRFVAYMKR